MKIIEDEIYQLHNSYQNIVAYISTLQGEEDSPESPKELQHKEELTQIHEYMYIAQDLTNRIQDLQGTENIQLTSNLTMLHNYYKFLLSEAVENNNNKPLYELKYHLLEICDKIKIY